MFPKNKLGKTKMKHKAVLFDLDGTLLDTANDLGEALNYVLKTKGLKSVDKQTYRPIASDGSKGLLELGFGDRLSEFDFEELRTEFLNYYEKNIAVHTSLYPGITELLSSLNSMNISWGIVTNKPEYLSKLLVPQFPQFNQCKTLIGGDTLAQRKPDPAPVLFACKEIGCEPKDCIYVGDAPRDIEAGNRAEMYTIIAQWGYILDVNECDNWAADVMTLNPLDILATIK
jgi:phosphoglycolate phosphatase